MLRTFSCLAHFWHYRRFVHADHRSPPDAGSHLESWMTVHFVVEQHLSNRAALSDYMHAVSDYMTVSKKCSFYFKAKKTDFRVQHYWAPALSTSRPHAARVIVNLSYTAPTLADT